ncbi:PAS domain S-box-containing protein [Rhizobiales bacterium GAS113]|nr:PAS domain S-box-containing protein [Rhizobiales bacterium GAS113]SEE57127.1 PAS domain S-box-containing protein [Rhizobiales bacterium GAS188]
MLSISSGMAGLIAAVCVPVTISLAVVALLLLRDLRRADRQALRREGEMEHVRDEIWQARESEERYRSLIEGQNDLILRRDRDGCIVYANAAFLEMAGQGEAIIGSRFVLTSAAISEATLTASGARSFDQEIDTSRGRRWLSWIETTVREPDGRMLTQSVGRDITERRIAEEAIAGAQRRAEAASAAKSRFLATVSHELRTPLSGIMGMADLLVDTGLTPEQTTYARAVKSSGESLLSLIDEILDFSKIESGKLELAHDVFDLTALVEGVVELLAPRAQDKGIEIASFIAPRTPRQLTGDPARLRQILLNLAGNAVKFSASGGVGLSVQVTAEGRTVFTVADTGEGIGPDRLQRIFEEFEQGEGAKAGAGLGLAISRRLVEMMGGTLTVESALGRGSTFTAQIPLAAVLQQPVPRRSFPAGSRALVVARSPFEAPYLCEKLRELGFEVDQAVDAPDALALLANSAAPQLLVVDAAIGEAAARAVAARAMEAGTQSRLVLLSPFERRQIGAPSVFGFDGYLVKPIRERSLRARLLDPDRREPLKGEPQETRSSPSLPAPLRVLLAEDDEVNALLATRLLERAGAVVERHQNGLAALDAAVGAVEGRRPPFDLALLDIRMPGLDGNEVARRLRKAEARLRHAPLKLVALTANAFTEDQATARAAGFDMFLVKPMRRDDLQRLLSQAPAKSKVA